MTLPVVQRSLSSPLMRTRLLCRNNLASPFALMIMAPTPPDSQTQATIDYVLQRADGLVGQRHDEDARSRSVGGRILGTQQEAHTGGCSVFWSCRKTAPSKTDLNELIEEQLKSERAMELERGHWEAAQLEELRDKLSRATSGSEAPELLSLCFNAC